jgi:hypothetical protein
MMAFAFVESLVATGVLVLLSAMLPSSWLRDGFAYKGFVILVIATIDALAFQKSLGDVYPPARTLLLLSLLPLVLIVVLLLALRSMPRLQNLLINVQDRFLILLFVYIPIGIISLLAVTFRNLL